MKHVYRTPATGDVQVALLGGWPKPLATARRIRPRLQRPGRQIEVIPRARIAMPAHAPNRVQAQLIDVQGFRVDQFVAHVGHQYFTENDLSRLADVQCHHPSTFQRHRGFANAWAFDAGAGDGGEAGGGQFVEAGGEGHGTDVHRLHQRIADDVDGEFLVELDIARGVLGALVAVVLHAQGKDGRIGRQRVEKAEGRSVDPAFGVDGGDQGNRPGHYAADQDFVFFAGAQLAEVEALHGRYL